MVAIPLLTGAKGTQQAEFSLSYPTNLEPLINDVGFSQAQLLHAAGAIPFTTGPGTDRGGYAWNGTMYRVMGTSLVRVGTDGVVTTIGDVGGSGPARLEESFGTALWYFNGTGLTQVTDVDLGPVIDMTWMNGFWISTDGTSIVVTQLTDPTQVDPLKYGSAEEDPDTVTGLMKVRNELYVLGQYTIQTQQLTGGSGYPFTNVLGATIPYGCISASAKCLFADSFAFAGQSRNEPLAVYLAGQGSATKISVRTVDDALAAEENPAGITLEVRAYRDERRLLVHLTKETWVFLPTATAKAQSPIWYRVRSGAKDPYRIRNAVEIAGRYMVGDLNSSALGWLSEDVSTHFGDAAEWSFHSGLLHNDGKSGIVRSIELIGLPGRIPAGEKATAFMSMTRDGTNWSPERAIDMGMAGETRKRLQWRPKARFTNTLGLKFRGYNKALPGFARLNGDVAAAQ
jgi:hypothetical protein